MATATRSLLLATALEVFAERGTDGGSMREIARRAGVNVATPYHHFGSKRDLVLAIFRERFVDAPSFDVWGPEPADPRDSLEALIALSLAFLVDGADVLRLAISEGVKGDPEVTALFERWQRNGDAMLENQLLRGGLADPGNVGQRGLVVRQVIWGTFTSSLIGAPMDEATFAQRAREAAQVLIEAWS